MAKRNVVENNVIEIEKKSKKLTLDDLTRIKPLTKNQSKFFNQYSSSNFFILSGVAGTGKTMISLYKAFEEVLSKETNCNKIIIVRSAVPSRDVGALPGNLSEKTEIYELPYHDICSKLFNRRDAFSKLKEQNYLEFMSTSYVRGLTLDNTIIIVDEIQNLTEHEADSIITRMGKDSKIIFCGDIFQNDLVMSREKSGFSTLINVSKYMPTTKHIEFGIDDIVRSDFIREYIIAKLRIKDENNRRTI